jgi:hypothetical protein
MTKFQIGHAAAVTFSDADISKALAQDDISTVIPADFQAFIDQSQKFEKTAFVPVLVDDLGEELRFRKAEDVKTNLEHEIVSKAVFGDFTPVKTTVSDRFASTREFRKRLHSALPEGAPAWLSAFLGGNESQARLALRRQLKTDLGL